MYKDILQFPFKFLKRNKEEIGVIEEITTPVLFATEQGIYVRYLDKKPRDNHVDVSSSHDLETKSTNASYRIEFCDYIELPSETDKVESDEEEKSSDSDSKYQTKLEKTMPQKGNVSAHSSKQVFTLSSRDIHEFGVLEERLDIRDFLDTNRTSSKVTFKKFIRE